MYEVIIKLNDETYEEVMNRTEFDTLTLGIKLIEAVQNGTPFNEQLEKIQRELNENVYSVTSIQSPFIRAKDMNEIIDKHIAELKGNNNVQS